MKKILCILLALVMVTAVFAGCNGTPAQSSGSTADKSSSKADGSSKADDDVGGEDEAPVDLVFLIADDNVPEYPMTNETPTVVKMREVLLEKFNVNYSIEAVLGGKFEEIVNTRLAAASDLPDVIRYGVGETRLNELYQTGLIIGLSDLIDEYAPDIKHNMQVDQPYLTIANGTADGEILRVPQVVAGAQHLITTLNIRKDFLDACGLDIPTTTEEFRNALVAFNENNVNGTGNIVFLASYANMNISLGTSFGVYNAHSAGNSWWYDDDMNLYHSLLTDNAKEYIAYVADLYANGLIFSAFTNYTADQWNEVIYANKAGASVGAWWDGVIQYGTLESKGIDGEPIPIRNLENPDGVSWNLLKNLGGYNKFMITKDCERPDKAIQVLNYGYTMEGSRLDYNGEIYPGGDYYVALDESTLDERLRGKMSPGWMVYTEKGHAAMDENPKLWDMMGWNKSLIPHYIYETAGDTANEFDEAFRNAKLAADIDYNLEHLNFFVENGVQQVGYAAPTDEQAARLTEFADLTAYIDENIQKFMMGARALNEWDTFLQEVEDMGLADLTAIMQDRFNSYVSVMDKMGAKVFE